jgi:N utilization substance protein A
VEQQMQGFSSGPATPIEAVTELGESIIQKLVAAGITTVEGLADMTPEQLEEIPGIGEKTLERISVAVRHYFGQYEAGEVDPNATASESEEAKATEVDEPGTPDEPTEEATAELTPESVQDDAGTETMEVENVADPERARPVDEDDVVPTPNPVDVEAVLEETEAAEEAGIDSGRDSGKGQGDV